MHGQPCMLLCCVAWCDSSALVPMDAYLVRIGVLSCLVLLYLAHLYVTTHSLAQHAHAGGS